MAQWDSDQVNLVDEGKDQCHDQQAISSILSIPPLIPAGFRGFRPESRNSAEFQEFRRIPAGMDRNPAGIDREYC